MEQCESRREASPGMLVGCLLAAGHQKQGRKHYHVKANRPEVWWTWWDEDEYKNPEGPDKVEIMSFAHLMDVCTNYNLVVDVEIATRRYFAAKDADKKLYFVRAWSTVCVLEE